MTLGIEARAVSAVHIGPTLVFVNVLLNQIGLPIPVLPTLILAGAVAGDGGAGLTGLFLATITACAIADGNWYLAGRRHGGAVMRMLCRVSLTPDVCVSQAHSRFERWGSNALIVGKFVPGLAIIAPPIAGATRMHPLRFALSTVLGACLWAGAALAAGRLIHPQVERWLPHLAGIGSIAAVGLAAALASFIAFKWWERRRFFLMLRMARITVADLYERMESQPAPLIVDARTHTAHGLEPRRIPGAIHVPLQEIQRHVQKLPPDREIILYCTCPNEASAAQAAKLLMKRGFTSVRPLHGGLEAWIAAGYAVESPPPGVMRAPTQGNEGN